ncbi:MAG: PilZ domain-containing protein [Sandaracinaceae bacterium]
MTEDLRLHPRCPVAMSAELTVGVETFAVSTVDLSLGGVGLTLSRALREGARVRVCVFLTQDGVEDPDTPPLDIQARVAWVAPSDDGSVRAGLRFESIDAKRQSRLMMLLHTLDMAA